ncbi:hypothetical protein [Streptomyces pristinaespiralis]|uniref:hypothetical protein n=1 Tax=Streptomyces pristinaespiralis TaxID=38300 RepID=UPI0038337B37
MRASRALAATVTAFAAVGLCAPMAAAGGGNGPRNVQVHPSSVFPGGILTITVDGCRRGGVVSSNAFPDAPLSSAGKDHGGDRGAGGNGGDRGAGGNGGDRGAGGDGGDRGTGGNGGNGGDRGDRGDRGDGGNGGNGGHGGDRDNGGTGGNGGNGGDRGTGGNGGNGGNGGHGGDRDNGGTGGNGGNGGDRGTGGTGGNGGNGGDRGTGGNGGESVATARVRNNATPGNYSLTVRCNDSRETATASFRVLPARGAQGGLGGSIGPTDVEMAIGAGLVATAAVGGSLFIVRRRRSVGGPA